MLDSIRSGAQSFWVKAAFGVIILVFVFWGVGNFNDRDYTNVVAVVNGQPILALEFEKAYQNAEEYIRRANPEITREQLEKMGLGRQVLNELIQQTLLAQEATRAGITVSPREMRREAASETAFQNAEGKFDPAAYERVLAARRVSVAQYEKELASRLLNDKMYALVTAPVWIDPDESRNVFNFLRERRSIDYAFFPASEFTSEVKIDDADAEAWYKERQADFAIPPRVSAEYIVVNAESLVDKNSIDENKARAWYEANSKRFAVPEKIKVRHILVPAAENADEAADKAALAQAEKIATEIKAGKSFAEAADENNGERAAGPGGELGWIGRGETVEPFEEAAFALEPGKISEPTRSPFGYHLILVEEKQNAGVKAFDAAKDEVLREIAVEEGSEKLRDALDALIEDNILGKPLAESAAKQGLKSQVSGLADVSELMKKLGVNEGGARALLAIPAGAPLDTALEAGDSYIVARIVDSAPAGVRPFADVKKEIVERLTRDRAEEAALTKANEVLEKVKNLPADQFKEFLPNLKTSEPLDRGALPPDFLPDETVGAAIFETPAGSWAPRAFRESRSGEPGALLARVDRIYPPDEKDFQAASEIIGQAARQARERALYEIFMRKLFDDAKIEITNKSLIDRTRG